MIKLKELAYDYDALAPVIGEETVRIHHDKHHQAYVDNLNKLLEGSELFELECPVEVLKNIDKVDEDKKQGVINNAGGVANHNLYWRELTPGGSKEPVGALKEAIEKTFGSFDAFKEEFQKAGASRFGSGWAWLVIDGDELKVISTPNQDSPVLEGKKPILGNDVWEHAYYLDYQNRRPDYLKAFWDIVNWDVVGEEYDKFCK